MSVYEYYKGGLINFKTVCRGLISGFIGTSCGAIMAIFINNQFMNYIVPILLIAVFTLNIFNKNIGVSNGKKRMNEIAFFTLFGFILGGYDGFSAQDW